MNFSTTPRKNNSLKVRIPKNAFNPVYLPLLDCEKRYIVLYGGAGSGKSVFAAQRYIIKLLKNKVCNLMVVRQTANTHRTSTFALFLNVISTWGLDKLFLINRSDMTITVKKNSNRIIFKGLDNSEKLKSVTFPSGELTDVWCEEASEIAEADFNQLNVRLRGKGTKKQIVVSFNPVDVNHWLKKQFFDDKKANAVVLHTTYKDNLFLDADYSAVLESFKESDPYYYAVYCLGQWGVYGATVFSAAAIQQRLDEIKGQKVCCGFFENGKFLEDENGYIRIYEEPQEGVPYVIGGDTAGDGSDFFAAQVLDNRTGKQVATLLHKFDEDIFADNILLLGKKYNYALVAIEANFSSYPIKMLEKKGYKKQFVRETEDEFTHKVLHSYGFKTTAKTRPVIIAELIKVFRESPALISDEKTLMEMLTFVRNEKGRPEAQQGAHDDLVMSLAIAHYARGQQTRECVAEKKPARKWERDMIEDYQNASEAERKQMIDLWGEPDF